jgi:diguanylate cyclase (GGDEF)-like protein
MSLRTRIALTFLLLLAAVLAAALGAVSAANNKDAAEEAERQLDVGASVFSNFLENNDRLLAQAATAVAADYGFRDAVAARDTDTLVSVLENHGTRIGAGMVVLTSLDGHVIAASGFRAAAGDVFPIAPLQRAHARADQQAWVIVEGGHIYQLVAVPVKSPQTVAWIAMGFDLSAAAARELAKITALGVTLSTRAQGRWTRVASTVPDLEPGNRDTKTRKITLMSLDGTQVEATLSRSLKEASASFDNLTSTLVKIGVVSLAGFAWAAFSIAKTITRPLHDLTLLVEQMRGGSYDAALEVKRDDELGVLAAGMQLMQTAVKTRDQSIRRLAYEDPLTGLMNRTAFGAALGATLGETLHAAEAATVAVAVINLQRFRRINEHLGYSVGDAVLKRIAERLTAVPGVGSSLARLHADQFAAFTSLRGPAELPQWGTSLLLALGETVLVETQPIDVNATVGLAIALGDAVAAGDAAADELLRCADLALEQARREKRPLAIYQDALKPSARDQLSLLGELGSAVERDELRLYFQPKIEMATQRVAGAEVLLRWQHPTRDLLTPSSFIPFAEHTGFIRRMTRWTLDRAIAQGAEWHRAGRPLALAVNISAEDLGDPRLDSRIAALLNRHQLPPSLLTLEITESGFIEDPERALRVLDSLAALGVMLSIDDFGTGYSSLSHLARMPVHEIKIDRSFVQGLETDLEFGAVVRSAVDMGHGLGLKVVAEGIETETSAKRLQNFGCDIAQGYFYASPMPLEQFEAWLEHRECVPVIAVPVNFNVADLNDTLSLTIY